LGGWRHVFWSDTHYCISLRYTRNIVQLISFYIKFDSKHFFNLCNKYYNRDQLLVAKIHVVEWSKLKKIRFDNTLLKVMNYTITNWRVSLSKICHEWPNNVWRLPVWNVIIRRYLASCMLQLWSNLTKIIFQIILLSWVGGAMFFEAIHIIVFPYATHDYYVSNWKSSYDVDNEMARN
jgi:hypothetical protein